MTKDQNDLLVRIATALNYQVLEISPAFYGTDFGRLELRNPTDGHEFSWNPLTHAGDRYALIKQLGMVADFSGKRGEIRLQFAPLVKWSLSFAKDDEQAEAAAVMRLAGDWAAATLQAKAQAATVN
jgi:hypothetical protein